MCFENDYDWVAHEEIDVVRRIETPCKCIECHEVIPLGDSARYIYLREGEEGYCVSCEEIHEDCQCEEMDHGEEFECWICLRCSSLRKSIEKVELAEGCSMPEANPAFGELFDALEHDDGRYLDQFEKDFPELKLPMGWAEKLDYMEKK